MKCPRCEHENPLGHLARRTRPARWPHQRNQAGEHLATATAMHREMGITYWLEKAAAVPIDAC